MSKANSLLFTEDLEFVRTRIKRDEYTVCAVDQCILSAGLCLFAPKALETDFVIFLARSRFNIFYFRSAEFLLFSIVLVMVLLREELNNNNNKKEWNPDRGFGVRIDRDSGHHFKVLSKSH